VLVTAFAVVPVYDRLRTVLDAEPETPTVAAEPPRLSGRISVDAVTFGYEESEQPVLESFTMQVEPGQLVGIVGPSGSGKSTIVRLLLGFEQPQRGRILYDGRDLLELDQRLLRRQIGVVLQGSRAVQSDILHTIIGLAPEATEADAWEAAEQAGIADDIRRLPMGMSTRLGSDSQSFSGGQVQKLLIARAIARRPRILIFDEATSALDNSSQSEVIQSLSRLTATRIVIAHRLSTVRNADRIYVLDRGKVVGEGRYDDLARENRLFAQLARGQLA
jgi:ABC-type bacteriocin/lantibiotic exporter with double-glycine peptidase domain